MGDIPLDVIVPLHSIVVPYRPSDASGCSLGWTNTATLGTILCYVFYWISVVGILVCEFYSFPWFSTLLGPFVLILHEWQI
jgi:cytosine/uracil/thiamine/allantoin permease